MMQFWSSPRSLRHMPFGVKYDCENHDLFWRLHTPIAVMKERGAPEDVHVVAWSPSCWQWRETARAPS
jgi:hypothetical protein